MDDNTPPRDEVGGVIVVSRFEGEPDLTKRAAAALEVLSARPGFVRGRFGRAADDPSVHVLVTEWDGVGAYRRALSAYEVKVHASPLLALGRDEASAFEVLLSAEDGAITTGSSDRA